MSPTVFKKTVFLSSLAESANACRCGVYKVNTETCVRAEHQWSLSSINPFVSFTGGWSRTSKHAEEDLLPDRWGTFSAFFVVRNQRIFLSGCLWCQKGCGVFIECTDSSFHLWWCFLYNPLVFPRYHDQFKSLLMISMPLEVLFILFVSFPGVEEPLASLPSAATELRVWLRYVRAVASH